MIAWNGSGNSDFAAWADFHHRVAAYHRAEGREALALANDEIAAKFERRAKRAAKRASKAVR